MIRRFLSNLVIVALLAAWGYSAWQAQQLRVQVRALQIENRSIRIKTERAFHMPKEAAANPPWLALANDHIKRAGNALSHADPARAELEMAAGSEAMQQALRAPVKKTDLAITQAHKQVTLLNARLQALQAQMNQLSLKTGLLRTQADQIKAQVQSYWRAHHY